ncbi:MAG: type II toxin-antitoxin system VapC family toxin [Euzebyaceae bacterium]|nr:type II toxin-antitoxin system VapC family toxin [Euzebyaceae bacterium]
MSGLLVADTDLVIDFLRGRGTGAELLPTWLRARRLRLSVVTLFELRCGQDWTRRGHGIDALFLNGPLLLDRKAALRAGAIEAQLRSAGTPIGVADTLQAGICRALGLPLATRNRDHFTRVEGLELVDLSAEGASPS